MTIQKLTKEFLLSRIADASYVHHEGTTLTHCLLKMKNGIVVDGKSACLNPADFDTEMGRKIAYDNAFAKLWELEGYARASKHAKEPAVVVTFKPGTPAFDTEALVSAIRTGGHAVVAEGVQVELLKEGQAKFSPEVRIVNCIDPGSGTADFLRGIDEAFRAAKRKPTVCGPHQDTPERVRWSLHSLLGDTLLTSTKPLTWGGLRHALEHIEREEFAYSICCWDKQTVLDARSIVGDVGDEWGERNSLHAAVCVVDRTGGLQ